MQRLELFYPTKPYIVGQKFGESNACVDIETKKKVLTKTNGTCPVGYTSLYETFGMKGHNGLDSVAHDGSPVYCAQDGIVQEVETEPERGLGIGIITDEKYNLGEYGEHYVKIRYWHLKGFNCVLGDKVSVGQVIGWADNTGFSSGTHLHFEIKPVEKDNQGNWYNTEQTIGYFGAIDPAPFWNNTYSSDWKVISYMINFIIKLQQQIISLYKKK